MAAHASRVVSYIKYYDTMPIRELSTSPVTFIAKEILKKIGNFFVWIANGPIACINFIATRAHGPQRGERRVIMPEQPVIRVIAPSPTAGPVAPPAISIEPLNLNVPDQGAPATVDSKHREGSPHTPVARLVVPGGIAVSPAVKVQSKLIQAAVDKQ